jgi:hypothetical protein
MPAPAPRQSRLLAMLAAAAALAGLFCLALVSVGSAVSAEARQPAPAALATQTPTPAVGRPITRTATPTATHGSGWLNLRSPRVPAGLVQTSRIFAGGGGGGPDMCNSLVAPPGVTVWAFTPTYGVVIGVPHAPAEFVIYACPPFTSVADSTPVSLYDPVGRIVTRTLGTLDYTFPDDALTGDYTVMVGEGPDFLTATVPAMSYLGPRLTISGLDLPVNTYSYPPARRGRNLTATYSGFNENAALEIGLYRYANTGPADANAEPDLVTLIDTWQVRADTAGAYQEQIPVAVDAPAGHYALVACDVANCQVEPYFYDQLRLEAPSQPSLDWQDFTIAPRMARLRICTDNAWDTVRRTCRSDESSVKGNAAFVGASWDWSGLRAGDRLRVVWIEDYEVLIDRRLTAEQTQQFAEAGGGFRLLPAIGSSAMRPGSYEIAVYINDFLDDEASLYVQAGQ